ncbi:MAG: twin-arginine translocase subunit TatC [Bacteroidota bacterium]
MPLDQIDVDQESLNVGDEKEMSFLDHLEELRWHLIRSVASIALFAVVVFLPGQWVFDNIILAPKQSSFITYQIINGIFPGLNFYPPDFQLITKELGEQFIVHLKVSMLLGLVISFPYIFWEIWRFIKPGLYETEQKAARGIVLVCSLLFLSGVFFGYFVISPFAITFLAGYNVGAVSAPTLASYVSYMTMFTVPTGLVFELPIVVYFLSKVGLLYPDFMRSYRRHAFVIILIMAAVITPPDVITQFLIGMPLFLLYEVSIVICQRVTKRAEEKSLSKT